MSRIGWWRLFIAGAVLIALGICAVGTGFVGGYLQRRGLDDADKIASVGGLFIGGIGLILTAITVVQGFRGLGPRGLHEPVTDQRQVRDSPVKHAMAVSPGSPVPVIDAEPSSGVSSHTTVELASDLDRLRVVTTVDHERLFGVERELKTLGESLKLRDGAWIISIFGGPGVGKTALAYELVKQYAREAGFHRVASVSAKFSHIDRIGHLEEDTRRAETDWWDLVVELAQQLAPEMDFNAGLIEQQFPTSMPERPCLIVVDNLETQEAELAVRYLASCGIIGPNKVILTTRESVLGTATRGLRERRWDGPSRPAAFEYAHYLAADDPTLEPTKRDLDDVVEAAERTPLLIQIIINQAREERLPIRDVITRLRDVGGQLGSAVWSYSYAQSLNVLAKRLDDADLVAGLMSVFCFRPAGSSLSSEEFWRLSGIEDKERFNRARAVACKLALVRSLAGNTRFTVHSLLREFYCKRGSRSS
jgi:hypothetical protein